MSSTLTDAELIDEIRGHNMAAFRTLYYRHVDHVHRLIARILGPHRYDIEDVVQEVFIQAHRSLEHFQGHSKFSTWLYRIAVNVCYSYMRRLSPDNLLTEDGLSPQFTPGISECQIDARRQVHRMYQLLDEMSAKNRMVFVFCEFEGLTLAEPADTLDIPLDTAASRLRRAREALMQSFIAAMPMNKGEEK